MFNLEVFIMDRKEVLFKMRLTILLTVFIAALLAASVQTSVAQNPKSAQWSKVGGKMVLSGSHSFTKTWTTDSNHSELGFWEGSFYDDYKKRKYAPWDDVVKNSVSPVVGQIVVQGPGNIGLLQRSKNGAAIHLSQGEEKAYFRAWRNDLYWKDNGWEGSVGEYNPNGEFWGKVPAGQIVTINVEAQMASYDNRMNTGEFAYHAPQEVQYEIWFFPRDGGKIIKVINAAGTIDKPQPGILYYHEKECN